MVRNWPVTCDVSHVLTPPSDVTDAQKETGYAWPVWDSAEDFGGKKEPRFQLRYRKEERVIIIEGKAQLTPLNGDAPFIVKAGDAVTFHAGFVADWIVMERMRKHFAFYADGQPCAEPNKAIPVIACDVCTKECIEEHHWLEESDEDICSKCLKVARGPDKRRFASAVLCKQGAPIVAAPAGEKKRKPEEKPAQKAKATKKA